jgi:arylsulfatase A-like enzyme
VTSNTGLRAGKGSAYEGGVRVPLIIDWPGGTKPGTKSAVPVITMDLYATIAAATGFDPPGDGVDIRPLLSGGTIPGRALFWHYPHYHPGGAAPYSAVLSQNWRLVRFHEDGREELYDLSVDPPEQREFTTSRPDKRTDLAKTLDAWLRETGAQMPVANPNFDKAKDAGAAASRCAAPKASPDEK